MRIHEGQKNHKCDLCNKAFSQHWILNQHIITVHEGQKNHKCDLCDKTFSHSYNLKRHINVHKGESYERFARKRALVKYQSQSEVIKHVCW